MSLRRAPRPGNPHPALSGGQAAHTRAVLRRGCLPLKRCQLVPAGSHRIAAQVHLRERDDLNVQVLRLVPQDRSEGAPRLLVLHIAGILPVIQVEDDPVAGCAHIVDTHQRAIP